MSSDVVIMLTGVLVASACALVGSFLVLRKMAMMADAISHAILPGLVAGYFLASGPNLLAGFAGAALAAVITVSLVEALQRTRKVGGESAIGIVFPAMFALGTFLVSKFFANVHLDTDAVLYGSIEFASLDTLSVGGVNLGPQSLWVMGALCVINLLFIGLFYKELKLATFDAGLAATLGFAPLLLHYALMTVVSITTVGAFTAVGAVLVVALMIVPAATAYLLTERLPVMIGLSVLIGAISALGGYAVAVALNASVAGAMATMTGVCFGLALLFSPTHGLVVKARRLGRQRLEFAAETLAVHLLTHEHTAREAWESAMAHLSAELRWTPEFAQRVVAQAQHAGLVTRDAERLRLTPEGHGRARQLAEA
ncbi:MAG: metal ABC transporter permease [Chloroflexales bacterium]|nr:metal ABC transporter permease [Chloroflexales bacterium]